MILTTAQSIAAGFQVAATITALTLTDARGLDTALSQNAMRFHGRIAIDALRASPPDGRTLLLTPASTVTVYADVYKNLSYNPFTDLAPVSLAATFVHGIAVGPMVPAEVKTLAQFASWAKANPEKASCGNPGEGSFPHFMTLVMAKALGAPIQPVPYRGGAPALNDMMANQLAALMLPDGSFLPFRDFIDWGKATRSGLNL